MTSTVQLGLTSNLFTLFNTAHQHFIRQKASILVLEGISEGSLHNVTLTEGEMSNGGKAGKSSTCTSPRREAAFNFLLGLDNANY
jgi:hypothetical protein